MQKGVKHLRGLYQVGGSPREKIAELIQDVPNASLTQTDALSLADLRTEYQKWLRKDASTPHPLKLIDPFTGKDVTSEMTDGHFKFVVNLQPVRIKEVAKASLQQNDASQERLEDGLR